MLKRKKTKFCALSAYCINVIKNIDMLGKADIIKTNTNK